MQYNILMPKKSFRVNSSEIVLPHWSRLLQKRREDLGLTREALAVKAGISPSLVAKLERGTHDIRDMSMGRLQALLRALRLASMDFLLAEESTEDFSQSSSGVTSLPYFSALLPACKRQDTSVRSAIDIRLLPPRPSYAHYFLAVVEREALCSENVPITEHSILLVERRPVKEPGITLVGLIEHVQRPLLFRLPEKPCLVRPVSGIGLVYWLMPDGSLQAPMGKKESIYPTLIGLVQGELRQP